MKRVQPIDQWPWSEARSLCKKAFGSPATSDMDCKIMKPVWQIHSQIVIPWSTFHIFVTENRVPPNSDSLRIIMIVFHIFQLIYVFFSLSLFSHRSTCTINMFHPPWRTEPFVFFFFEQTCSPLWERRWGDEKPMWVDQQLISRVERAWWFLDVICYVLPGLWRRRRRWRWWGRRWRWGRWRWRWRWRRRRWRRWGRRWRWGRWRWRWWRWWWWWCWWWWWAKLANSFLMVDATSKFFFEYHPVFVRICIYPKWLQ